MYIIYIPKLDFSSLLFSAIYFCSSSFNISSLYGRTIQHHKWRHVHKHIVLGMLVMY
jgi:hypothetical protein